MKIGYLTELTDNSLDFMQQTHLHEAEIICDRGIQFDVGNMTEDDVKRLKERFDQHDIHLGAFAWYITNHLEPNIDSRKENFAYFKKMIQAGRIFGTDIISFGTQHHPSLTIAGHMAEALGLYKDNFTEYSRIAANEGVKICIENCPEFGNLAYSPEAIDAMYDIVPSDSIFLELDPSHLVWERIDPIRFVYYYKDKIISVHAKDADDEENNLFKYGIAGKMLGEVKDTDWIWRYRLPGFGNLDWKGFFHALYEIHYNGNVYIEMEDPLFFGNEISGVSDISKLNKQKEGATLSMRFLQNYIV